MLMLMKLDTIVTRTREHYGIGFTPFPREKEKATIPCKSTVWPLFSPWGVEHMAHASGSSSMGVGHHK